MLKDWRTPTSQEALEFIDYIRLSMLNKFYDGVKEYGPIWAGSDPLDHLEKELIDALWYLWWEKRKLGQDTKD